MKVQTLFFSVIPLLILAGNTSGQIPAKTFPEAARQVISRSAFRHAQFGISICSLDQKRTLFSLNSDKLFTPASTTKLLTEGTALQLLGPDYRFRTPVYRTGTIGKDGMLKGDLVLVASGDPNLSSRVQPDGTLAFENVDHSDGGPDAKVVPGDPLLVLRELAHQIASAGIKSIQGRVWVDERLFPHVQVDDMTVSPVVVNDNLIDMTIVPGTAVGAPAKLQVLFAVPHIRFDNKVTTGDARTDVTLDSSDPREDPSGIQTVTVSGSIARDSGPYAYSYSVPDPARFAAELLTRVLREEGIKVGGELHHKTPDWSKFRTSYTAQNKVAEHISASLSEEVKVTLKVSQNLHADTAPFNIGALLGKATDHVDKKGFELEHQFLAQAGLDLTGASQGDGAGGNAYFTPDFMVHYLAYMSQQPTFVAFQHALPVLGRDGTLAAIQVASPAAGHVFAKTGTNWSDDLLNGRSMLTSKALAGYTTTPNGEHLVFAIYLNNVALPPHQPNAAETLAGQALGEIAAAIYLLPIDRSTLN